MPRRPKQEQRNFRLTAEEDLAVSVLAQHYHVSRSEIVRRMIQYYWRAWEAEEVPHYEEETITECQEPLKFIQVFTKSEKNSTSKLQDLLNLLTDSDESKGSDTTNERGASNSPKSTGEKPSTSSTE